MHRGLLTMMFHLLSLFRLLACPAGQERVAAPDAHGQPLAWLDVWAL